MYLYEGTIEKWTYTKVVNKNRGYGLRKPTSWFIMGGDRHYYKFRGKLKYSRFYYQDALPKNLLFANMLHGN